MFGLECPLSANPTIPARRTLPVVLSEREMQALLRACAELREKTLIGLLFDTGMRKSEALDVAVHDLDFDRGKIHIREGKRRKDRYVPFSRNMQKVVARYLREYHPRSYLFEREPGKPRGKAWPAKVLAGAIGRAGIAKHAGCHALRHTYATTLLEHGVEIRHYGILAPGNRKVLAALQVELGNPPVAVRDRGRKRWKDIAAARGLVTGLCPNCGVGILIVVKTLPHIRSPERNPSLHVG